MTVGAFALHTGMRVSRSCDGACGLLVAHVAGFDNAVFGQQPAALGTVNVVAEIASLGGIGGVVYRAIGARVAFFAGLALGVCGEQMSGFRTVGIMT